MKALLRDQVISISTDVAVACRIMHLMQPDPIIHQDVISTNMHAFRANLIWQLDDLVKVSV